MLPSGPSNSAFTQRGAKPRVCKISVGVLMNFTGVLSLELFIRARCETRPFIQTFTNTGRVHMVLFLAALQNTNHIFIQ